MTSLFKQTTTYDPIYCFLNAESEDERNELTLRWKDNKLQELNFVGIVGALLGNVLTSTNSWPRILPNGVPTPWTVRTCWFIGILTALTSVITAAQQAIRLHRLSCHPQANAHIRRLLSHDRRTIDGVILPRRMQVWAWQISGMMLALSVLAMVVGMFILIWSSTGHDTGTAEWWDGEAKLAVTFTVTAGVIGVLFLLQAWTLYSGQRKDDRLQ